MWRNPVKTCPKMQKMIQQIAERHQCSLTTVGSKLRLKMVHYDPLVITVLGAHLISVAHLYEPAGHDPLGDPEITFFTKHEVWIPLDVMQLMGGYRAYAVLTPDLQEISLVAPDSQADLADFAEIWAQNIEDQGWLEHGQKQDLPTSHEPPHDGKPSRWPDPTTEEPDWETLEDWIMDGDCEATDGCFIEPDGVCPHGHPSWLLKLGLM
jgi:hypothetical protein